MRIFKCSFAKFSRGSIPPDPPKRGRAFGTPTNAICDVTTFISAISSPPTETLLEPPLVCTRCNILRVCQPQQHEV